MTYFDNYFKFPTIHIDGDYELTKDKKNEQMGTGHTEFNPEFLICETEIAPVDEIITLTEAWYPNEDGFIYARDKEKFSCTRVTFADAGTFLCSLSKNKFKKLWSDFKESLPEEEEVIELTKEEIEQFLNQMNKEDADIEG